MIPALVCVLLLAWPALVRAESELYRQGKLAFSSRQYDRAYDLFSRAAQAAPGDGNPLFYMGYILEQQSRRSQAMDLYRRAVDQGRMDRDLREKAFWKVVLYYKQRQDWDNLYVYSERFLKYNDTGAVRKLFALAEEKRDPRVTQINRLMAAGNAARKDGRLSAAAAHYREALSVRADYSPARWELALIQMQLKEHRAAEENLRTLIADEPERWEFHYKAGVCNYHLQRYDEALTDLKEAKRLNPKPDRSFTYFVHFAEGQIHLEREAYAASRDAFLVAQAKRQTARLHGGLARARYELGEFVEADTSARAALKEDPEQTDALLVHTRGLFRVGDPQAYEYGTRLLNLLEATEKQKEFPERYTAYLVQLGAAATKRKDWPLALRAFDRVHIKKLMSLYKQEMADGATKNSLREYNLNYGIALYNADQLDQAIVVLKRVDGLPAATYMVAQACARRLDDSCAREHLKRAAESEGRYWDECRADPAFATLLQSRPEFSEFVRNRGREPEPVLPVDPLKPTPTEKPPGAQG